MGLPLSRQVFAILSGLVESQAGLHYGEENRELFADKVSGPAIEAGFDSLLDYYYFLRYDPAGGAALARLVSSLLVHETYFFREAVSLEALVVHALEPRIRSGARPRVWCAACATGEEPLTLAMLLADRDLLHRVELHATDLSQAALDRAIRGEFGGRSLRSLPPGVAGRHLDVQGDVARVRPYLREAIRWSTLNLMDHAAIARMGRFDAVLCRNVLIYFSDETAAQVVEHLTGALEPGGSLVVGVSESLLRFGTRLLCEERGGAFFYTRPEHD